VTGAKAAEAVDKILATPHGSALSTHLTKLGFTRTHDDQVAAIQSDARGQDQLAYVWYSNATGERARLLDLASNPKAGGITVITGSGAHYLADSYRVADTGEVAHVEHGVLSGSHATVTYLDTGETKSLLGPSLPSLPAIPRRVLARSSMPRHVGATIAGPGSVGRRAMRVPSLRFDRSFILRTLLLVEPPSRLRLRYCLDIRL
jgi:hypothetical protein